MTSIRSEVDRDVLVRKPQSDRMKCIADPLAAFGHRLVRQTDDAEGRAARSNADLHLDSASFDSDKRNRCDMAVHDALSAALKFSVIAEACAAITNIRASLAEYG